MALGFLGLIAGIILVVRGVFGLVGALRPTPGKESPRGSPSAAGAFVRSIGVLAYGSAIIVWTVMINHHASHSLAGLVFISGALVLTIAVSIAGSLDRKR